MAIGPCTSNFGGYDMQKVGGLAHRRSGALLMEGQGPCSWKVRGPA